MTLFPEMFAPVLGASVLGRAVRRGIIEIGIVDIREYSKDKHKKADDYPYGGGSGMVMSPQPLYDGWVTTVSPGGANNAPASTTVSPGGANSAPAAVKTIYLSPQGRTLTNAKALELSREKHLVLICGHYEGVDERVLDLICDEEISIGDYILTGGEIPAMALIDCVSRLIPGVLPSKAAYMDESHYYGYLEYPQYTRPESFMGAGVPDVLLNGNHAEIERWRFGAALERTRRKRPDALAAYPRRIALNNTDNMRDLGGYPAMDGSVTRWRTYFRSDAIDALTQGDKEYLLGIGLTTVIDLRSEDAARKEPDSITEADGVRCYIMPVVSDAAIEKSIRNAPFKELYILLAEKGRKKFGKIFKIISESRGACLFHCYAGKDRTGIVAALLLMLAGVADADVIADYEVSGTYFRRRYATLDFPYLSEANEQAYSHPETIEHFIRHIRKKYGGAYEYLLEAGVPAGNLKLIGSKFLAPAKP